MTGSLKHRLGSRLATSLIVAFARGLKGVGVLFLVCFHSGSAQESGPGTARGLEVTVKVYNAVHLSSDELGLAEQNAAKIFQEAGISIIWSAVPLDRDANDYSSPDERSRAYLRLRLWPRAMAGKRPSGADTLGFCVSMENGEAVILTDTIQKRASYGTTSAVDLLGLVMAHEMGHLLLRSPAHGKTGIMRAQWIPKERDVNRGHLFFTPKEADAIRNEVRRRLTIKSVR